MYHTLRKKNTIFILENTELTENVILLFDLLLSHPPVLPRSVGNRDSARPLVWLPSQQGLASL